MVMLMLVKIFVYFLLISNFLSLGLFEDRIIVDFTTAGSGVTLKETKCEHEVVKHLTLAAHRFVIVAPICNSYPSLK